MSFGNSRVIVSNQTDIHDKLDEVVNRHLASTFQKPISEHTQLAFEQVIERVASHDGDIILDACCGVGESSYNLAKLSPDCLVIGVDKSLNRLSRHEQSFQRQNLLLVRADLNDFYRLLAAQNWPIVKQCLFYPNPWPKSKHLQRRWHGAPVFPTLAKIAPVIELRSNWLLYLQEFQFALAKLAINSEIQPLPDTDAITPFERKYRASGQPLYQLITR